MLIPDLYAKTLNNITNGKFAEDCSKKLQGLIDACRDTGKAGKITVEIEIKPDDVGRYKFIPKCTTKEPTGPIYGTILWGTPDGNLQRYDPAQQELELRDVSVQPEVREVAAKPAPVKSVS